MKKDFIERVTSRKFWVTVGSFITLVASKQYDEAVMIVLGYLGVNAVAEVSANRKKEAE